MNLYDNAMTEATNRILKKELICRRSWPDIEALRRELNQYVRWHNNVRMHSTLDYMIAPLKFVQKRVANPLLAKPEAVVCYPKLRTGRQARMEAKDIVVFESSDGDISLPVRVDACNDEVWLNRRQLAALYGRDVKTIGKHINNSLKEELSEQDGPVVAKFATTAEDGKTYQVEHYSLDVILSVGYRVKSKRGIEFRRWANEVLRKYILQGRVENEKRLRQLGEVAGVIRRLDGELEAGQVLDVIESYTAALDMLDDYDHQTLSRPEGSASTYVLSYGECRTFIDRMRFGAESDLFGNEKDESFRGSIGSIYQGFGGQDLYPSVEEKAANLLYFVGEEPLVQRREQAHSRRAIPVLPRQERQAVRRRAQAPRRQHARRRHHHDRRVEAGREGGHGLAGDELPCRQPIRKQLGRRARSEAMRGAGKVFP